MASTGGCGTCQRAKLASVETPIFSLLDCPLGVSNELQAHPSRCNRCQTRPPQPLASCPTPWSPFSSLAGLFRALAPRLSGELALYALPYVRTVSRRNRIQALDALVPHLANRLRAAPGETARAIADWQETVRILTADGRPELLNGLAALMPWLEALGGVQTLREVYVAISEVSRCWP